MGVGIRICIYCDVQSTHTDRRVDEYLRMDIPGKCHMQIDGEPVLLVVRCIILTTHPF